ncbi:hypothetical protein M758_10G033000 [Ceratodon purpureus]|nr:hypothetical protein M758_10G033000 [Ceratodon purpureus]
MTIHRNLLLLMLNCVFITVDANFNMLQTPLKSSDIKCIDQCEFFADNQTIVLINVTNKITVSGVAYYTTPIRMKDPATKTVASFNTTFTFREDPKNYDSSPNVTLQQMQQWAWGDGFTFMMSNSNTWEGSPGGRLGIFSDTMVDTKVVAVEFDNFANEDVDKQNYMGPGAKPKVDEHMGLDINSAISVCTANLSYRTTNLSFWQRQELHAWIEYNGNTSVLELRVANTSSRPSHPLFNCTHNLYDAIEEKMWVGFSGAIGNEWTMYYMYNWTFTSFGISPDFPSDNTNANVALIAGICGGIFLAFVAITIGICVYLRRKRSQQESWDKEGLLDMSGMPEFISYKHLSAATKQFSDQSKLGQGGFGSVYRGILPKTGAHVAVKKVSNDSRQGEREFLAEVQIISQLRHRNVVELTGFCRDRGKFLLVYELLPNGSLDRAIFKPRSQEDVLSWPQRWKIVSGTAAALHYLHEGWRQQVIHRDVKSSNIMLDDEYNAKLGDFGLARLVDHSKNAATTMVAGTYGYIAPEAAGGRFTDKTDVFAFGAVALEVACGRRAYDGKVESEDDLILVDMVWRHLKEGTLLNMVDPKLQGQYDTDEMVTVLKLGLLCSHPEAAARPSMRQVVEVLAGDVDVPEVPEAMPEASLDPDMPKISIDDLLNASSGPVSGSMSKSGRGKRPAQESTPSSSNSFNSFGVEMRGR